MKGPLLIAAVMVLVVSSTEGRSYYRSRHSKHLCPPRACTLEYIPVECRIPQYFYHNGRPCKDCDRNGCIGGWPGESWPRRRGEDLFFENRRNFW